MFVNLMSVHGMARKLFVTQFAISFMIIPFRTPTPHNSTTNLHTRSRRQTQPLSNDRRRRPAVSLPVSDISCAHASEMVYDIPITAPVPHRPAPRRPNAVQRSDNGWQLPGPDKPDTGTDGRTLSASCGPRRTSPRAKWTVMAQRISLFAHCNHNARTHATNANTYVTVAACARRARPKVLPAPLSRLQFTGFELGALGFWGAARLSGCHCHKRPAAKPGTRVVCWRGLFITVLSRMRLSRPTHAYTRTSARLLCAFVCV